ncbi:hypothetical protein PoB_002197700 [Plakobranchus ocellatus]|uniref:Uncharacterized protein n=1 Tax=Plakobranchus ocellatus TaxID=259542 RepID=A0AAV3ZLG0_9GAST|nr:hypothetical protein PoB_002197700 [Plakobranchus ocellatus]
MTILMLMVMMTRLMITILTFTIETIIIFSAVFSLVIPHKRHDGKSSICSLETTSYGRTTPVVQTQLPHGDDDDNDAAAAAADDDDDDDDDDDKDDDDKDISDGDYYT